MKFAALRYSTFDSQQQYFIWCMSLTYGTCKSKMAQKLLFYLHICTARFNMPVDRIVPSMSKAIKLNLEKGLRW